MTMTTILRLISALCILILAMIAPTFAGVTPLTGILSVSVGENFSCALRNDGSVWCWGVNDSGQLGVATPRFDGNDQYNTAMNAVKVATLSNVISVASGRRHSCALRSDQTVWCWGYNYSGQLGAPAIAGSQVPLKVSALPAVKSIHLGAANTCAVSTSNQLWCWGDFQYFGGSGLFIPGRPDAERAVPALIPALSNVRSMALGDDVACAVLLAGDVYCWGSSGDGQIGDGAATSYPNTPQRVVGLLDAQSLTVGYNNVCAVRRTGAVVCWGEFPTVDNSAHHEASNTPVAVEVGIAMKTLSSRNGVCGVAIDASVLCWGDSAEAFAAAPHEPEFVFREGAIRPALNGLASGIAISSTHSCVVMLSGEVKCWGSAYRALGIGWGGSVQFRPWYPQSVLERGIWPSTGTYVVSDPTKRGTLSVDDDIVLAASVEGINPSGTVDFFDATQNMVCSGASIALPSKKYEIWGAWTGGYPSYAYCTLPKSTRPPGTYAWTTRYNGDANHGVAVGDAGSIKLEAGPARMRTIIEFHYAPLDYYFMTSRPEEIALLDVTTGWVRTNSKFRVSAVARDVAAAPYVLPMSRFYFDKVARGQSRGSHFYTSLDADRKLLRDQNPENLLAPGKPFDEGVDSWGYSTVANGIGTMMCGYYGYLSVYRLFRATPDDPNHRFTTDAAVVDAFTRLGWRMEYTAFCALP